MRTSFFLAVAMLLFVLYSPKSHGDMGAIVPYRNVTVNEPGQKAIIAHVYFVFDLVDLSGRTDTIAPLVYRFQSKEHFYYPLQTSNLFHGDGTVELYVFSDRGSVHNALKWPSKWQGKDASSQAGAQFRWSLSSATAHVNRQEMQSIAPEIADLMGANALLCAYRYEGRIQFTTDLWLNTPLIVFGPKPGSVRVSPHSMSLHTPARGTPERTAILETLRLYHGRSGNQKVVFVVKHLKVKTGWAWIHALPRDKAGKNQYEDISALMRNTGGNRF
jgi:hypothetical protein